MSRRRRGLFRLCGAVAALLTLAGALQVGAAARPSRRTIADGVVYRLYKLNNPRNKVRVVTFNPKSAATIDVALANDKLPGLETTSSMARRSRALVAINGDYAQPSGRPVYTFARDGALEQMARLDARGESLYGRNFAIDRQEQQTFITHPKTRAYAFDKDAGISYRVDRINDGPVALDELVQFTPSGGSEERPPQNACSARLRPIGEPQPRSAPVAPRGMQLAGAVEADYYVERVVCRTRRLSPHGGIVLSAPLGGTYDPVIRGLLAGEGIVLGWSLNWPGVFDSVGGNPTLIEDGAIQSQSVDDGSAFASMRAPRTAVAYNAATTRLFLVTVDGRRPGYSVGMSLRRLASSLRLASVRPTLSTSTVAARPPWSCVRATAPIRSRAARPTQPASGR